MQHADSAPRLSVVIVTWNCAKLIGPCLESVREQAGDVDYEVIVVDNASADGTLQAITQTGVAVELIANQKNLGFAVACNQGIALARGELLFLLNPDTLLGQPATLQRLCEKMDHCPEISMAGVRLVFPDGRYQVGDAGHCPTVWAVVAHALFLSQFCQSCFPGLVLQPVRPRGAYRKVGWVCGGCTIVRRSAIAAAGPLDESFFLYGEDIEWGCRYTNAGLTVAYLPDIEIVHVQSGTQKADDPDAPPPTRWIDGLARLFQRYNQGRHFWAFRVSMATGFALRALIFRLAALVGAGGPTMQRRGRVLQAYAVHVWQLPRPGA